MLHRFALALLVMLAAWPSAADARSARASRVVVCLIPGDDCTALIVNAIKAAKTEIFVQAYGFTSCPIINALIDAKERDVKVHVILDKSNLARRYIGAIGRLQQHGIQPLIDYVHRGIAHSKIIIIDNKLVFAGSMNFTCAAQYRNVENLLRLRGIIIARTYLKQWHEREGVSQPAPPVDPAIRLHCPC